MAVLKEAIDKVGRFDEQLGPGEEIELGCRIEKAGYRIDFAPKASVWHNRNMSFRVFLRKIYRIGYIRVVLARRHKGLLQVGHMLPCIGLLTLLFLIILSILFSDASAALIFTLGVYSLVLIASGIQAVFKVRDIRALFVVPVLIPLHHACHGIGYLVAGIKHLLGFKDF
jgi:GT2 family glycosyltransferase